MMHKSLSPALRLMLASIVVIACAMLFAARLSRSIANGADEKKRIWAEQVRGFVRAGLGREINLAASPEDVWASLDSVTNCIRERSGLKLDQGLINRLADLEDRVLTGKARRITARELGALLTGVALDRIKNGTDAEIEQVADGFTNVRVIHPPAQGDGQTAPGRGKSTAQPQDDLMLRSTGQGIMSKGTFVKEAKALRSSLQSPVMFVTLLGLTRREAVRLVTERVGSFADALPEEWGQAEREGLTPVQSLLVIYSAASDDRLWYSNAELRQMMKASERKLKEATRVTISCEGKTAYGTGGYIFSTPLDVALDQRTTARVLDLIAERSAK